MEDIMRIVEMAKQADEKLGKASARFARARERLVRARREFQRARAKREEILRAFKEEYRRRTGISIKATKDAVARLRRTTEDDRVDYLKKRFAQMISEAHDIQQLGKAIRRAANLARREEAIKQLARHQELLDAAWRLGLLEEEDIAVIMWWAGKEVD